MARTPLVRRPGRAPHEASAGDDLRFRALGLGLLLLRLGPALILLVLVVVVSLTTPIFFTSRNIGNVFSQTAVISVLALGQLLVIVTRGIDLSVGSTVALSSVVGAIVFTHVQSGVLVIAAILGVGVAVGAANGVIFVFGRIPHPFIVTLATLSIVRGIALWAAHGTLIPGMPHAVQVLGGGSIGWLPYSFFIVLGLALLGVVLTSVLVWGRWLYAVGGNPDAARRTGIPVKKVLVSVYVLSGLTAASRRPHHRRADGRGLSDLRRPRGARLDRRRHHRRRGLRGRARPRRQCPRRRVHDRRDPQRAQPARGQRLLPADGDRRRDPRGGRGRRPPRLRRGALPGRRSDEGAMSEAPPALAIRGATKHFGAVTALDGVDLDVRRAEVLALLGDNGAGKSTLIKCISGAHRLDGGSIEMDGAPVTIHTPADARALGIETVYQDLALFDNLRPSDNFYAGRELAGPAWLPRSLRVLRRRRMADATHEVLDRLGVSLPRLDDPVGLMSGGQRQAVAVSRAAAFASNVVILDEPTAALGVRESESVLDLIRRLRHDGKAVIVISHALDHVLEVANRVVVLRRGRKVGELPASREARTRIVSLIVGGAD